MQCSHFVNLQLGGLNYATHSHHQASILVIAARDESADNKSCDHFHGGHETANSRLRIFELKTLTSAKSAVASKFLCLKYVWTCPPHCGACHTLRLKTYLTCGVSRLFLRKKTVFFFMGLTEPVEPLDNVPGHVVFRRLLKVRGAHSEAYGTSWWFIIFHRSRISSIWLDYLYKKQYNKI